MNQRMRRIAVGVWLLVLPALPAQAKTPVGIPDAISKAESAWGGHAISVAMDRQRNGRLVYEVALLEGDTVKKAIIDALSGEPVDRRNALVNTYRLRLLDRETLTHARHAKQLGPILKRLEDRTKGNVVEASFEVRAGQARYEVDISTEAGVAEIYLDPKTGERIAMVYDD